ncbi:MAG TPA: hypothetical protein VJO35_13935 [Terriglobales bacterium]|nr:hypothetical protein [Terriglobales bacterium]
MHACFIGAINRRDWKRNKRKARRDIDNRGTSSGIAQFQSGADLQASVTSNFNYSAYIPQGTTFVGVTTTSAVGASNSNILGTPDITLMPVLNCNPHDGLKANQFANASCFANAHFVVPGQQGPYVIPSLTGPGFFNTDLIGIQELRNRTI